MEKSSKRGKIPQQDWPSIIKRYEAGETLSSIARTYDCSPPAISYILSRSRARGATAEGTEQSGIETAEPRLMKGHPEDMPARDSLNATPEIGEAAPLTPTAQGSSPIDRSDTEPVSVGADPVTQMGRRELPKEEWKLPWRRLRTLQPSGILKRRLKPLRQETGMRQAPLRPARNHKLGSPAALFTFRCRTTILS